MDNWLCIYHGNCADGFTAAWIVRKARGAAVDFYPGAYGTEPPDVEGRDIIIVDFSYKRPVMERITASAKSVVVLDHHKTAAEDLRDLPGATVVFDMERSGAMIAWEHFFPGVPAPKLVQHVQDRDLWRFALPGTREIQACVFSYPYTFEAWDALAEQCERDAQSLMAEGRAIERKHFKDIEELLGVTSRPMMIGGYLIEVANLPYTMSSDAGHALAQRQAFGACYWDTPEGRVFSLRSTDGGPDVSEIARQYGGGGHRNAAGFRVPRHLAAMMEIDAPDG